MENRISATLSETAKASLNDAYNDIERAMPFLLSLTKSEKLGYLNLSDKQASISAKVLEWLENNPGRFTETNREELGKDLSIRKDLTALRIKHKALGAKIDSTITRSSQEAMFEMRLLKRNVETGFVRDPSLLPLKEMLDDFFARD